MKTILKFLFCSLIILLVSIPIGASADSPYSRIVFFGDSLSDPGNFYVAKGAISLQPFEPIPVAPYAIGGMHFSNGSTWAERLAITLNSPNSGGPALRTSKFSNYAVGRARARSGSPVFSEFDLMTQISHFLTDLNGSTAPTDALYAIWIGSNDLGEAIGALKIDPTGATSNAIITDAITATADNIVSLYAAGAQKFMVANLPDLSITPAFIAQGPAVQAAAHFLSIVYNSGLEGALSNLENTFPNIQIIRLDIFRVLNEEVFSATPAFSNVNSACLTLGVVGGKSLICPNPNDYLFWDGFHPTTGGHEFLSNKALEVLTTP